MSVSAGLGTAASIAGGGQAAELGTHGAGVFGIVTTPQAGVPQPMQPPAGGGAALAPSPSLKRRAPLESGAAKRAGGGGRYPRLEKGVDDAEERELRRLEGR